MFRSLRVKAVPVAITSAAFGAMAIVLAGIGVSPVSAAGIADTKHNLGSTGTGVNTWDGTTEVCVFCHTPHGSASATPAAGPLWNKSAPSSTYTAYNTSATLESKESSDASIKASVSFACLSCHDGSQAMDSFINAPGSGNTASGTWTGANQTGGKITSIANLTADLSDDHPIAMHYANYGTGATVRDADVIGAVKLGNRWVVNVDSYQVTADGGTTWTAATGDAAKVEKTDMILYTRGAEDVPYVECASCHDPHSTNNLFLRIENYKSQVCLACHAK